MRQKNIMRKVLTTLWIVQEKTEVNALKRAEIKYRFNPYNPLAYICILVSLLFIFLTSGINGLKELKGTNIFRWN